MRKLITFAVPCYNSAAYMGKCIDSLLKAGEEAEILIVDDGSVKDNTAEIADEYEAKYPGICKAIHQENAGHGGAVNTGIEHATGYYFKVVDSDDWVDEDSLHEVMDQIRTFVEEKKTVDMIIANYVYEHTLDNTSCVIGYEKVLPENVIFGWNEVRRFKPDQNLLMHSVIYRTKVLRKCGLKLPTHTFYVDNLFVYVPLPEVKTMYYMNTDLYRYFIGREDQSVNEQIMISRIDQQIRVNKLMIDAYDLETEIPNKHLRRYMRSYLATICMVSSFIMMVSKTEENQEKRKELWKYFKEQKRATYRKVRWGLRGFVSNPKNRLSRKVLVKGYHIAQRIYKFN